MHGEEDEQRDDAHSDEAAGHVSDSENQKKRSLCRLPDEAKGPMNLLCGRHRSLFGQCRMKQLSSNLNVASRPWVQGYDVIFARRLLGMQGQIGIESAVQMKALHDAGVVQRRLDSAKVTGVVVGTRAQKGEK